MKVPEKKESSNLGQQWESFFDKESDFQGQSLPKEISTFVQSLCQYNLLGDVHNVLDCGCGSGEASIDLTLMGLNVTALDYSETMLREMKGLLSSLKKEKSSLKIQPVRADMMELPFEDGSYDLTFSIGALEHWLDEDSRRHVLREMARVTKSSGKVIIVVPNGKHFLYGLWRFIIKQDTPEEVQHSARSLADEIRTFGFPEVRVFPMSVNKGFSKYLRFKWLRLPVLWGCTIIDLLPMFLRLRLTVHFLCTAEIP